MTNDEGSLRIPFTCSDFIRNEDGKWSLKVSMTIAGVLYGSGVSILPGMVTDGFDILEWLNKNC